MSIAAPAIEKFVVEQIKAIGRDPALVEATIAEVRTIAEARAVELEERLAHAKRQLRCDTDAVRNADGDPDVLAGYLERAETSRKRVAEVRRSLRLHEADRIPDAEIKRALVEFDSVWSTLSPAEQIRVIETLIEYVEFDGAAGKVAIELGAVGLKTLAVSRENRPVRIKHRHNDGLDVQDA